MMICPCGSGRQFAECCEPILQGTCAAETPEQLMRARYSAYATAHVDFLHDSLHPDARSDFDPEGTRNWAAGSEWRNLEIVSAGIGSPDADSGTVEFIATFAQQGSELKHHEVSRFKKHNGRWHLVDGKTIGPKPVTRETPKVGRNEPCPCGSAKKYKKCCGG